MTDPVIAAADPALRARAVRHVPLRYTEGADTTLDRPAHVRAGSSLAAVPGGIALVQDDANFVAVVADGGARVRAIALGIACEIHPLNNLRVLNYLTGTLGATEAQKNGWYKYWIDVGFEALERQLARDDATGTFCHGEAPTLADICLVPQLANARRFKIDVSPYATLVRIEAACQALSAFAQAAPAHQPDAE